MIEVAYAPRPRRNSADQEIARRVASDTEPAAVRVVTSDLRLAERVRAIGATVGSSGPFRTRIEDV
ncbi:MAG TPA: NYN domain-containing protein [Solirubrobacteraceae bacterium]